MFIKTFLHNNTVSAGQYCVHLNYSYLGFCCRLRVESWNGSCKWKSIWVFRNFSPAVINKSWSPNYILLLSLECLKKRIPWTKSRSLISKADINRNIKKGLQFITYNVVCCTTDPTLLPRIIFQWFSTFWFPGLAWLHCVVSLSYW